MGECGREKAGECVSMCEYLCVKLRLETVFVL